MTFSTLRYAPSGMPAKPCTHEPGSVERIQTLEARAARNEFLFHPDDAVRDSVIGDLQAFWQLFARCQQQVADTQQRQRDTFESAYQGAIAGGYSDLHATEAAQAAAREVHIERIGGNGVTERTRSDRVDAVTTS